MIRVCVCTLDTPWATEQAIRTLFYYNRGIDLQVSLCGPPSLYWAPGFSERFGLAWEPYSTDIGASAHCLNLSRCWLRHNEPYFLALDTDFTFINHGILKRMIETIENDHSVYAVSPDDKYDAVEWPDEGKCPPHWGVNRSALKARLPIHCCLFPRDESLTRIVETVGFRSAMILDAPVAEFCCTSSLFGNIAEGILGRKFVSLGLHGQFKHWGCVTWAGKYPVMADMFKRISEDHPLVSMNEKPKSSSEVRC